MPEDHRLMASREKDFYPYTDKLRIVTDPTQECKATPHPDAVASGTCPSPSDDGGLLDDVLPGASSDAPTEPQLTSTSSGSDTSSSDSVPVSPAQDDELPVTGASLTGPLVIGFVMLVVGTLMLRWWRLRRLRS